MSIKEFLATNPVIGKINDGIYRAKPAICVTAGMIGTGAAIYLAWRAGRKTDAVLEEVKNDISEVKEKRPKEVTDAPTGKVSYIAEDGQLEKSEYNRELLKVYFKAAYKLGKIAAPAAMTEVLSLVLIGHGFGMLNSRFVGAASAANAYATALATYRSRVRADVGDEKEHQLYYGTHEETIEEPELDKNGEQKLTKEGKPKIKKTKIEVLEEELAKHSPYARIFDAEYCSQFETDSKTGEEDIWYNGKLIKDSERMFNDLIRYRPYHMFTLNDIYDHFKFDKSAEGQYLGWHCRMVNGQPIFDIGDPDGIKIIVTPVYYYENGILKKSYIMDFNLTNENNILGYYPKVQRKRKDIENK